MAPGYEYGTDTISGQRAVLYMGTLFQSANHHAGVNAEEVALDARIRGAVGLARLRVASRPSSWRAPRPVRVCRTVTMRRRSPAERRPRATRRPAGRARARSKARPAGAA